MSSVRTPVFALLAALLALAGCASNRTAGESVDDTTLTASTKTALAKVGANVASGINVDVDLGRVLLVGFVDSAQQKTDALAAVQKVQGHKAVIDGLVVMPGTRSTGMTLDDQTLQTKVKWAITNANGWEKGLAINTECKNGEILLSAWVANPKHREIAGKAAAEVAGVKKVHNFVTPR